jgi:hypothetical protein
MPKKMTLICLKYFLENTYSLSHHIMKEKRRKNIYIHPIPHHQRNIFLKNKKNPKLPTLKNNETSPSHATQKDNTLT